jgi:transcriptional repressor NrdR
MRCPYCGHEEDKVVDSRSSKEGRAIRRRRECLECEKRFTTYEYIESVPLTVVKNDQRREPYDRQKLMAGIISACKKRPISMKKVESVVDKIENELSKLSRTEVPSLRVGELVMQELAELDDVAYVRFASVYRKFKGRDEFITEVEGIGSKTSDEQPKVRK